MKTAGYKPIGKQEMRHLVSKNLLVSVLSKVFYLGTRLFIPPFVLAYVGQAEYGLWAMCFVLISYLGLGAFGVSNVYVRYVASYHACDEMDKINGLISTGMALISTVSLILLGIFWLILPVLINQVFKIPSDYPGTDLHHTAYVLFYSTALIFLLELNLSAFMYVLNGLQKITETSLILVTSALLETLLIVLFLLLGFGIYALLLAFAIRYVVSMFVYISLCFKVLPSLSVGLQYVKWEYVLLFYRFGSIVQIAGILGIITRSADKLLAASLIHIYAVGALELASKLPLMAVTIPSSMNSVFLPASSYMHSQKRHQEMLDMYLGGSRLVGLMVGFIMGYITVFSIPLIMAWLGAKTEYDALLIAYIMLFFTIPQQLHVLTGPGSAIFNGINKPIRTLFYPLLRLSLIFLLIVIGVQLMLIDWEAVTLLDIVIVVNLATLIAAIIYGSYINLSIGLSNITYLEKVLLPSFVPYLVGLGLFYLLCSFEVDLYSRWHSVQFVLFSGILYTIINSLVIYYLVLNIDERNNVLRRLNSIKQLLNKA
jgi:O-antigen/teichoic acid export membrane protein